MGAALTVELDASRVHEDADFSIHISTVRVEYGLPRSCHRLASNPLTVTSSDTAEDGSEASGELIERTVLHTGQQDSAGPCLVQAGLAYSRSWVNERDTVFDTYRNDALEIPAGGTITLTFPLQQVPEDVLTLFSSRLATLWSDDVDDEPDVDSIGLVFCVGSFYEAVAYLPLPSS